jgi:hypothetical protein
MHERREKGKEQLMTSNLWTYVFLFSIAKEVGTGELKRAEAGDVKQVRNASDDESFKDDVTSAMH